MADPATALAALGTASTVIQVVDFSSKVALAAFQYASSSHGALKENHDIERLTRDYNKIAGKVCDQDVKPLSANEQLVNDLAEKCTLQAGELLTLLEKIKIPTSSHGIGKIWQSVSKGAKATWKKSEISSRRQSLNELNSQLATALLQLLRSNEWAHFEDLLNLIQLQSKNIAAAIVNSRDTILQRLQDTNFSDKARSIIESLEFAEMRIRRETIAPAVHDTYEWIFSDSSSAFRTWVRSEGGLFWISGKAGSGKSTLMKFLSSHSMTPKLMEQWTGSREFLIVDFYFWYLGTPLQKSVEGLMRSILYQILSSNPEVTKIACPQRWGGDVRSSFGRVSETWTEAELEQALANIASTDLFQKRLCFFIDGLDEFHGDHQRLVTIMQTLARHDRIKLCVSSRPWNVFVKGFEQNVPQIRLEDLTRNDIVRYVYGELHDLPESGIFKQLVSEVVDLAQGVFLWVFLVVTSLKSGFVEGDDIEIMRQRLNSFPSDLEDYFDLILSRVESVYKKRTAMFLQLAMVSYGLPSGNVAQFLLWWLVSHSGESLDIQRSFEEQYVSDLEIGKMAKETQKSLRAACKDLLYVSSTGDGCWDSQVIFLHRTVYEYLQSDRLHDLLGKNCPPHFGDDTFLIRLQLAWFKQIPCHLSTLRQYYPVMDQLLQQIESKGLESELGTEFAHILPHYIRQPSKNDPRTHLYCGFGDSLNDDVINCDFHTLVSHTLRLQPEVIHGTKHHPWPVLYAALGLLEIHKFSLQSVDLKFVEMLLEAGANPNQCPPHGRVTTWHLFLYKWYIYLATMPSLLSQESHVKLGEEIWPIVSALLEYGADQDSLVLMDDCAKYKDGSLLEETTLPPPQAQTKKKLRLQSYKDSSHPMFLPRVCSVRRIIEFCISGVIVEGVHTVTFPRSKVKQAKS